MKNKLLNIFAIFLIFLSALFLFSTSSFSQTPATKLSLNKPINNEIKGDEGHFYSINLEAGQTAQVEVIQNGVEISLSAYNPQGNRFAHSWALSGLFGKEKILVIAKTTGEHKVEVSTYFSNARPGKYTIVLKEVRPSVRRDFLKNVASILLTKTFRQAEGFRAGNRRESKLKAIERLNDVIRLAGIIETPVWVAAALAIQGTIYQDLSEIQKALDAYLKSLEIWQRLGNRQNEGVLISNLGSIYQNLGEYEKAISYYKQAIKINREVKNFEGLSTGLNNLATLYSNFRSYEQAKKLYREAIALDEKYKQWEYKDRLSNTLSNLGMTLLKNKEFIEGMKVFSKALDLRQEIKDYSGLAHSYLFMGRFLWKEGEKEEYKKTGYKNLLQARNLARDIGDRALEAEASYFLAIAEKDMGSVKNIERGIDYAGRALSISEYLRGKIVNSKSRYGYFSTVQKYYELYIDLIVSHYEKTKDQQDIEISLRISESSRSRSLLDLLDKANVELKQGVNLKDAEKLKGLQRELNNKYAIRKQTSNSQQRSAINAQINNLNTEIQKLQLKIRQENPKYADLKEGKVIRANEIKALLDEEDVLLEYKLGKERSFVWLVTKDSIEVFKLPPRREIESKARSFYDLVVGDKRIQETKRTEIAKDLSEILFSQFSEKLVNKRLVIIPDGVLQYTPFSALRSPKSESQNLIDTNEIVMLPSASVLSQIRKNPQKRKANSKTIAIFADPVFDNEDSRIPQEFASKSPLVKNISIKQSLRDFNWGETLPRLLASRREAKNISGLVGTEGEDVKMDFEANLKAVETTDLSKYQIIHFATHGLLNSSRPEFSGLVFSLYDKKGQEQAGFLSLNDIYNLKLSSDMVVLSACQTAFGKDVKGEGLIGLSRGFLYAGSNRVIASYWKVDDFATAEFMKRFYRNHLEKGMPAVKALQQTKIEMKKIPRYKSPFYWSAFTLFGDWK